MAETNPENKPASATTQAVAKVAEEVLGKAKAADQQLGEALRKELTEQADKVARVEQVIEQREATWRERFEAAAQQSHRLHYKGHFPNEQIARVVGLAIMARTIRDAEEREKAAEALKREKASISPGTGTGGGWLTIEEMVAGIIANVDQYGVTERLFRVWPDIGGESVSRRRRKTGATTYCPDYGQTPTESTLTGEKITAMLTKFQTLVIYDKWMARDTLAAALAEYVADEMKLSHALYQDQCGIIGDGSDDYARITGLFKQAASGHLRVEADSGDDTFSEVVAAANKYPAELLAKLPRWVHQLGVTFLMDHSLFFSFWGLQDDSGKPLIQFLGAQDQVPFRLMGYPVEFTGVGPAMSDTTQASTVCMAAGHFSRAYEIWRNKGGHTIEMSDQVRFMEDEVAVKMTVRQTMGEVDPNAYATLATAAT